MERTTITFLKSPQETEKALLNFSTASKAGIFLRRYTFPIVAVIVFAVVLMQSDVDGEFIAFGRSYPLITFLFRLYPPIAMGLLSGWLLSSMVQGRRKTIIVQGLKSLPPDYFGQVTITLDASRLSYDAPLYKQEYDWKLFDSILVTPDFLFICSGEGLRQSLVIWIPMRLLNGQSATMISNIERWLSENKNSRVVMSEAA